MSESLRCTRIDNPFLALGCTVHLLRRVQPFRSYRFGHLANVLSGQISRGHYVLTFHDKEIVGYFGWALCTEEVARAWVERNHPPRPEECIDGECFVVATFYAESREATFFQTRHVRKLYPNVKVFGRRAKGKQLRPMRLRNVMAHAGERAD